MVNLQDNNSHKEVGEHKADILECLVDLSNDEVFTPPKIANEILDLLPKEIWQDKNIKFLDPCCKSGVFLREIAKRLDEGLSNQIPDAEKRKDHILANQVYGIAITEFTAWVSRRTVYCSRTANGTHSIVKHLFRNERGNIMYDALDHNWDRGKCTDCPATRDMFGDKEQEGHAYQFIHTELPKEFKNIKFDVIIGNPPYQMDDGGYGASAAPLYHKFIEQAKKLNPKYLSMIIPARWYLGGKGLDSFREEMLNDTKISDLTDYPLAKDCFPNNDITGGICYFLWDKDYDGYCNFISVKNKTKSEPIKRKLNEHGSIFIRNTDALSILEKIQVHKEKLFFDKMSKSKPFGLRTYFRGEEKPFKNSIKIYQTHSIGYTAAINIKKKTEWIKTHKVIISQARGGADQGPDSILSEPIYSEPNSACTETYLVAGIYENKTEAENAISYIKTKFFRFLVSLKKNTQHATSKVYEFVPMQDFSKPWTDAELYKKYDLTRKEINHIENTITQMN